MSVVLKDGVFAKKYIDVYEICAEFSDEDDDSNNYRIGQHIKDSEVLECSGNYMNIAKSIIEYNKKSLAAANVEKINNVAIASKPIKKGDELFLSYGADYWIAHHGLEEDENVIKAQSILKNITDNTKHIQFAKNCISCSSKNKTIPISMGYTWSTITSSNLYKITMNKIVERIMKTLNN